jgi:hypothetical protein
MDYRAWGFWKDILLLAINFCFWIWVFLDRKNKATNERVSKVEGEQAETDKKVSLIEQSIGPCAKHRDQTTGMERVVAELRSEIKHLPSQKDIARVHVRMDTVTTEMNQAVGELNATRRQLDLVLEELLRREK